MASRQTGPLTHLGQVLIPCIFLVTLAILGSLASSLQAYHTTNTASGNPARLLKEAAVPFHSRPSLDRGISTRAAASPIHGEGRRAGGDSPEPPALSPTSPADGTMAEGRIPSPAGPASAGGIPSPSPSWVMPTGWGKLNLSGGLGPSSNGSMVYDETDGYLLFFGGYDGAYLGSTWKLVGESWQKMTPLLSPPARSAATMTYDMTDGYVLLFGGTNGNYLGDTWEFRDGNWTELYAQTQGPTSGSATCFVYSGGTNTSTLAPCPSPRVGASMTFDSQNGSVLLFGGEGTQFLNDTWTFAGGAWSHGAIPSAPSPRSEAALSYDVADGEIVLFGGLNGGYLGDTWVYRDGTWSMDSSSPGSPSAREGAALSFDMGSGHLVLFGGSNGSVLGDTWEFAGVTWTRMTGFPSPAARDGAAFAYDYAAGHLVLLGGYGTGYLLDPWGFRVGSGEGWAQQTPAQLPVGLGAVEAYDYADGYALAFGGFHNALLQNTWAYRGGTWVELEAPAHAPGSGSDVCFAYNGGANTSQTTACPPPRYWTSMAFDFHDGYLVLYGGFGSGYLGDTWAFQGGTWTELEQADTASTCWRDPPSDTVTGACPSAREGPALRYDPENGSLVLFGGYDGSSYFNDTWVFVGGSWVDLAPPGTVPFGRYNAGLVYDPANGYLLLFGGYGCPNRACSPWYALNDTWEYRGGSWREIFPPGQTPSARYSVAIAYDAADGYAVLFGGWGCLVPPSCSTFGYMGDTWSYSGGHWKTLSLSLSPGPRSSPVMDYDASDGSLLLAAGTNGGDLSDVWEYSDPFVAGNLTATPRYLDTGQAVTFATSASGGQSPYSYAYSGLPPGCSSVNATSLTCNPSAPGNYVIRVQVSDRSGYSLVSSLSLPVYSMPSIVSVLPSRMSSDVGQRVNFTALPSSSSDPSENYSWTAPIGMGCTTTIGAVLPCRAIAANASYTVSVTATDPDGFTSSAKSSSPYSVYRDPATTRPVPSVRSVDVGQSVTFNATLLSKGRGNDTFSWNALPPGCNGVNGLSVGPCKANAAGTTVISLTITDENGFSSANSSVTFTVYSDPQLLLPTANRTSTDIGQSVLFTGTPSGGLTPYTLTWTASSPGLGCLPSWNLTLRCSPTVQGTYTVTLLLVDGNGIKTSNTSAAFRAFALPSASAPRASVTVLDAGEVVVFHSALLDPGSGGDLYRWETSSPGLSCTSGGNLTSSCKAGSAGNYSVVLRLTDSNGGTSSNRSVSVRFLVDPTVSPPLLSPLSIVLGSGADISVNVTGGMGPYVYEWSDLPPGCSSNGIHFHCTPSSAGTYTISVTVKDATGYSVTSSATTLTVTTTSSTMAGQSAIGLWTLLLLGVVIFLAVAGARAVVDRVHGREQE